MNPRRVHALMTEHFPPLDLANLKWINVLEADGKVRSRVLGALIDEFTQADEVLVQMNRKLGDLIARDQLMSYLQDHVGQGQIRLAGRDFRGFVLIAANGVAAGWSAA